MFTARLEGEAVQIVSSGLSDVGRVRTNNEDSFRIVEAIFTKLDRGRPVLVQSRLR